jgi:stage V sporulation protein R
VDREIKDLEKAMERIWELALEMGLDPFPVNFEIVPATVMYEIGSYALPGRFSHWTFGKAYHKMKTMYDFGLSRIYEVVINTNPAYGFLLETNSPLQNKLVIAHVLGHVDFFKNNAYFSRTNRRMVDEVGVHAQRIEEYEFKYGRKTVEEFLDAVMSIEEHIDANFFVRKERERDPKQNPTVPHVGEFDDLLTPGEISTRDGAPTPIHIPGTPFYPEKDLIWFIAQHSPSLAPWERDVMLMIHQEMLYFVPQMQTKTINEGWACLTGDALVATERGFIPFEELYGRGERIAVASGGADERHPITEFHKEEQVPTIRIRTRRGLTVEGAEKHRIRFADGTWAYLRDVKTGDRLHVECGSNVWSATPQKIHFEPLASDPTIARIADLAGVSSQTVIRHLNGTHQPRSAAAIDRVVTATNYQRGYAGKVLSSRRTELRHPGVLTEDLAWLLGNFIGDGNRTKSGICITSGDTEVIARAASIIQDTLGLRALIHRDASDTGGRWRLVVHSRELLRFLRALGIDLAATARQKRIPAIVLRSPKPVVSAFLQGYFDADGYAGPQGVILSSASEELIRQTQIILLNYGMLSTQRCQPDGCIQLHISGASAGRFAAEIGFGLARKRDRLNDFVTNRQWFCREDFTDEIVSVEHRTNDVFDISVATKEAYVANGLLHHNSFWHSRIMRELCEGTDDFVEFAELHASVVSPHKGQLNPYYLGYKILEDIERRWESPTAEEKAKYGRKGGEGRQKLFEVRETENDVSLLRNYLTEELVEELDLYVFELVDEEEWTVTEKRWERVRDQLVANMTNFGFPHIEVTDGDYNRNRELYLTHRYEGAELDLKYARKVLEYVFKLWGRKVHLETRVDDDSLVLHFDGTNHDED